MTLFVAVHRVRNWHGAAERGCPHSRRVLEGKLTNHGHWTFGANDPAARAATHRAADERDELRRSLALKGTNLPASDVEGSTNRDWVGRRGHAQKPCRRFDLRVTQEHPNHLQVAGALQDRAR